VVNKQATPFSLKGKRRCSLPNICHFRFSPVSHNRPPSGLAGRAFLFSALVSHILSMPASGFFFRTLPIPKPSVVFYRAPIFSAGTDE